MIKSALRHKLKVEQITNEENILIYQMGKVGSSTIEKSLEQAGVKNLHIHNLVQAKNYNFNGTTKISAAKDLTLNWYYRKKIKSTKRKIKIISLMRDPISRNISTLFQELPRMLFLHSQQDNRAEENKHQMLADLMEKYVNEVVPLSWFTDELKFFFGINIFDYPFDKEKGYRIIQEKNIEILLLTSEKLNENKSIIAKFINLESLDLSDTNISSNKWYSDLYSEFKENYKIDAVKAEKFYNSKIVNYFYSKPEIEKMKSRWKK